MTKRATPPMRDRGCYCVANASTTETHSTPPVRQMRVLQVLGSPLKDGTEDRRKPPSGPQAHPLTRDLGARPLKGELCLPPVPTHKEGGTRSPTHPSRKVPPTAVILSDEL